MKVNLLSLFFLFGLVKPLKAQDFSFGIKGGLDYHFLGKINPPKGYLQNKKTSSLAWQGGAFSLIGFYSFFIQPELSYRFFKTSYLIFANENFAFKSNNLDLALLIGKDFLKHFRAFIGPTISFNLNTKIEPLKATFIDKSRWSTAFEIGLGMGYLCLLLDLRYQRALTPPKSSLKLDYDTFSLQSPANKLMLSLGILF